MRTVYGRSPWLDQFPRSRVPSYRGFRGGLEVDVAVVGGGLTGCAVAAACASDGRTVALFEADRIGRGDTGASTGWVTTEPAVAFADLQSRLGTRAARLAYEAWLDAARALARQVRRLDLACRFTPADTLLVARTDEQQARLVRERRLRQAAGIAGALAAARVASAAAGFPVDAALRSRGSAVLDPYRATLGFAATAVRRGAVVFERSPVLRSKADGTGVILTLGAGTVRARQVVVATGAPAPLFRPLARHLSVSTRFAVLTERLPAPLRRRLGTRDHLLTDQAPVPHRVSWVDDERLLVSGADGPPLPVRVRDRVLVQRTAQLMYELSTLYPDISGVAPAYGWDSRAVSTPNGLPIVGAHRNFPHHLFACGCLSHGVTGAYLAAGIVVRQSRGEHTPADEVFGFPRSA